MASKRHERKKACEWKRSYSTLQEAKNASGKLYRWTGSRTWAYRCPFCGLFHHGHTSSKSKRIRRAQGNY